MAEPNYKKFKLSNGIKCVLYPREEIHSVKVKVIVNTGSLDEDEMTNGLSHFIEHVVHDGTEKLPTWDAIDDYTNQYSGSTNAYTSSDHTQYYGTFPNQYVDQALFFFSQIVFHPLFKDSDIEKERAIILDELKRGEDETDFLIYRNVKENRFVDSTTPFSYEIIGTRDLLQNYKTQDLIDFYNLHYVPENTEIYIVGNIDIEKTKEYLKNHFENSIVHKNFKSKPVRKFKESYPKYSQFKINAKKKQDISQYYLTLNFPSFEYYSSTQESRSKESFLKSIVATGEFFQSILWKRLREELGIVYGIGTYTYNLNSRAMNIIQTSFDKKYLETVLKEIYIGIEQVKSGNITDTVFLAKQRKIIDTQLMQLDSPDNMINWIINQEDELETHNRALTLEEYLEFVNKLKFDEVIDIAKNIYDWQNVNIGIVSSDDPRTVEEDVKKYWNIFTSQQQGLFS
ncbi:insulinase family protein [Candidatus Dojkabacteria bacterium]|uniref:Insulinase family protein n=1 Tax=Candidatus Dojkabacteria bacterium TaxID=2099670 RepID=A0A955IA57_9BACT|nr:insulinase family protein [Candidatus Dojkabacteria bacterium]